MSQRRQDWTIRLIEEYKNSERCIFLTLTYDENYPHFGNLDKVLIQKWLKRFRKAISPRRIRYYLVGEYGTKTFRPHYHALLFGCDASDYDIICNTWSIDGISIGFAYIGTVTERSISYICKYHVNRTSYPAGLVPSFVLMSKSIGISYVKRMADYHSKSLDNAFYKDYELKRKLPRYYKNKLYSDTEREEISLRLMSSASNLKRMEKWLQKHPNSDYFADLQSRYEECKRKFKEKSSLNEKL